MDGWEIKASIMVDEAESRSITLSSAPPHTLTLAQMRAHRSKEQQTHASDLYVVNNRMMVTSSGLGYWPFGGHSFQTSPWRSRAGANVDEVAKATERKECANEFISVGCSVLEFLFSNFKSRGSL